ncbi:MAG: hypothetical protein KAH21_10085, partial [Spirochaetaceae bacterium]|nr:hypothetical protein [Spirochaetaceae bacterium]
EDWNYFIREISGDSSAVLNQLDLVIFTGPDSPSSLLSTGGSSGGTIPWLSLAPRGNGLARVTMKAGEKTELEIIPLERGVSPEDTRILALGDSYMEELISSVTPSRKSSVFKPIYWYPYGCKSCEEFLWNAVPGIERRTGQTLSIIEKNTGNPDDFDELLKMMDEKELELVSIPVMLIGNTVLQGENEIEAGLESLLNGETLNSREAVFSRGNPLSWEPGAVFMAGLLDGVNPCAFSAMVFLVSALAMAGRSKKTMLAIGMFYALGIFITYSLIGAGLLGGLKRIAVNAQIRNLLEYILAGFLLILSVLSLLDGLKISRGRTDLILKLPEKLSKRVHKLIREEVRSGAAAGGAFLLGTAVALIELGCTGQVYLPAIAWMISRSEGAVPWLWLILYNIAFIIPLFIVFG